MTWNACCRGVEGCHKGRAFTDGEVCGVDAHLGVLFGVRFLCGEPFISICRLENSSVFPALFSYRTSKRLGACVQILRVFADSRSFNRSTAAPSSGARVLLLHRHSQQGSARLCAIPVGDRSNPTVGCERAFLRGKCLNSCTCRRALLLLPTGFFFKPF